MIMHAPDGGWMSTARDWDENRHINFLDHLELVKARREERERKRRRDGGFSRDDQWLTLEQRHHIRARDRSVKRGGGK